MPRHDYCCPRHGKFEVQLLVKDDVPLGMRCPAPLRNSRIVCFKWSPWVPPIVSFPGGPTTGARPPILREDNDA